jgi:predicted CoA-substrate-specific enzyme activase
VICAGIDAGSRIVKAVVLDAASRTILATGSASQGIQQEELARKLLDRLLEEEDLERGSVRHITATGYGRRLIRFADRAITEITCHARGVHYWIPEAATVIEIGGQDSKFIKLSKGGSVEDFAMNDRCAAGTGRFFESVAAQLGIDLNRLGEMAVEGRNPSTISSMCVVFAETEIIGLLASGTSPEEVVAGVQVSIAKRLTSMIPGTIADPLVFTGGVALIRGMDATLEAVLGHPVRIVPEPLLTGALGAALLAADL